MSPRPDATSGRGFTLMEVTLAMGISAILLLAMGGALMVTTSAVDTASDSSAQMLQSGGVSAQFGAELSVATEIYSINPKDIYFAVPDRDGDGYPEEIEYTWSGTGAPLMRSYQGAAPVAVIPSVQTLTFSTANRSPAVPVEGAEATLLSCESPSGSASQTGTVDDSHFQAQYVRPPMPSGASSWKITRVKLYMAKTSGNTKPLRVSICTADASLKPTKTILASAAFTSGAIGSAAWYEFAVGPITGLAPTQGVCIVVDSTGGDVSVYRMANGSNQPFNSHFMTSDASWTWSTPNDTQDLKFILTGTITTLVEP